MGFDESISVCKVSQRIYFKVYSWHLIFYRFHSWYERTICTWRVTFSECRSQNSEVSYSSSCNNNGRAFIGNGLEQSSLTILAKTCTSFFSVIHHNFIIITFPKEELVKLSSIFPSFDLVMRTGPGIYSVQPKALSKVDIEASNYK